MTGKIPTLRKVWQELDFFPRIVIKKIMTEWTRPS